MKRMLLIAAVFTAPLPALAWDAKTSCPSGACPVGQDGGMAQGQAQRQSQGQHQTATGGKASSHSAATGGKATVNFTYNDPSAAAGDPSGGYSGGGYARRAPDVFIPSVGGGGADCPVVGFGAGGSGMGGGGGFGPSWISSRCDHRRYAEVIYALTGDRLAALEYLASVEPDVRKWLDARPFQSVALPPAAEVLHGTSGADGYCSEHMTWAERHRHPECGK